MRTSSGVGLAFRVRVSSACGVRTGDQLLPLSALERISSAERLEHVSARVRVGVRVRVIGLQGCRAIHCQVTLSVTPSVTPFVRCNPLHRYYTLFLGV